MLAICSTSIDWSATGSMLSALFTGAAVVVGWLGLRAWSTQRCAQRAEELLAAIYPIPDAMKEVRSPMVWAGELERTKEKLAEATGAGKFGIRSLAHLERAQVTIDRLGDSAHHWRRLAELRPSAQMHFGPAMDDVLTGLLGQRNKVWAAATTLPGCDDEHAAPFLAILDGQLEPQWPDAVANEIERLVGVGEQILLPAVRAGAPKTASSSR